MARLVLIVDDDKTILNSLSRSLSLAGYDVKAVGTGEEALTFCSANHCDVVIMDIELPGQDGLTILGKIRLIKPDIKVIVISGYYTEMIGDVYLPKPVTGMELTKTIKSLFIEP